MSIALYMDHHVRREVVEGLRRRGIDVLTAYEDGFSAHSDVDLFARATSLKRVLFSQDDDLLELASEWQQSGRPFAGLVYAHQMAITVGQAVRDLELFCRALDERDAANRIQFLPL